MICEVAEIDDTVADVAAAAGTIRSRRDTAYPMIGPITDNTIADSQTIRTGPRVLRSRRSVPHATAESHNAHSAQYRIQAAIMTHPP
jgi:hypothetical protein